MTIHKSQGQTLSSAIVSMQDTYRNPAQAYVGVSRVRCAKNLYVIYYQPNSFLCDPYVLHYNAKFRSPGGKSALETV